MQLENLFSSYDTLYFFLFIDFFLKVFYFIYFCGQKVITFIHKNNTLSSTFSLKSIHVFLKQRR